MLHKGLEVSTGRHGLLKGHLGQQVSKWVVPEALSIVRG